MKNIIFLIFLVTSSWYANGQQTYTISGNFLDQGQAVINQEITVTYNSLDSLSPILGNDTTFTDSLGFYTFTKTISAIPFQGYAILKTTDCYGSMQEKYVLLFPNNNNLTLNFECINICLNSFIASVDSIPGIGLMATFKASNVTGSSNYQWTFGDGSTAVGAYVDHIYLNAGTYTVCLTTSDIFGACTYTYCDSVIVQKTINQCYSIFNYYADSADSKLIYFTGQTGNAPGSIITWDFGDGYVLTGNSYVSHTYAQPGIYNVCLGYFDIFQNCFATYCDVVYVGSGITPNCNAEFKMFMIPDSVTSGANVVYFSSTYQSTTSNYTWDFGDGSYGFGNFDTHVYDSMGVFNVCLIVNDPFQNCSDTICKRIEIIENGMKILGIEKTRNLTINYVYPNPAKVKTYVNLSSKINSVANISLITLDGRTIKNWNKVLTTGTNNLELELSDIDAGLYFIKIYTNEEHLTTKLLIR